MYMLLLNNCLSVLDAANVQIIIARMLPDYVIHLQFTCRIAAAVAAATDDDDDDEDDNIIISTLLCCTIKLPAVKLRRQEN